MGFPLGQRAEGNQPVRPPPFRVAAHQVAALILIPFLPQELVPPGDSTYANPGLQEVVERAAAAHARPPKRLTSFTSEAESEIALLLRGTDGSERPTQVEQIAGRVAWRSDGTLQQEVQGYRSLFAGLTVSLLTLMEAPWVIGPLYGDRVPVLFALDSLDGSAGDSLPGEHEGKPPEEGVAGGQVGGTGRMIHPFASDRADYYRFSGGDTALILSLPEREVPLIRVWVDAREVPDDAFVFQGEIHLDATRYEIVRMRGQVLGRPGRPSLYTRVLRSAVRVFQFLEVENAEWEGSFWLPHRQRFEIDVAPAFSEDQAILRIVTAFDEIAVNPFDPVGPPDTGFMARRQRLRVAGTESLQGFRDWRAELGAATAEASLDDFTDVAPESMRTTGRPRLQFGTGSFSDFARFDRVEGLFTGFGVRLGLRDAAPGVVVGFSGGYAWAESTLRGRVSADLQREGWSLGASAERRLASTNDFPRTFRVRPTILGLLGEDDFDYVDRYSAGIRVGAQGVSGGAVTLEAGAVRDREAHQHVHWSSFRELRPIHEGDYGHLQVTVGAGGPSGGEFLSPGVSAAVSWEVAWGDLDWHRVEGVVRVRRQRARWSLAGEIHGGMLHSDRPPPQALFELGSLAGRLPGFEYKAFSGDRAAVLGGQVMYGLPWLEAPIRIGPLFFPAVAPSPVLELSAGWTGASGSAAALMEALGWTHSDGIRATLFMGLRLFGGALGFGMARAVGEPGPWRFEMGLAPGA